MFLIIICSFTFVVYILHILPKTLRKLYCGLIKIKKNIRKSLKSNENLENTNLGSKTKIIKFYKIIIRFCYFCVPTRIIF